MITENITGYIRWNPPAKIDPGMTRIWPRHLPIDAIVDFYLDGVPTPYIGKPAEDLSWGALTNGITHYRISNQQGSYGDNKYMREIKPGVFVDVYDVLKAFRVTCPALQHLIKKALAVGERGHKTEHEDLDDIVDSALRAQELAQ